MELIKLAAWLMLFSINLSVHLSEDFVPCNRKCLYSLDCMALTDINKEGIFFQDPTRKTSITGSAETIIEYLKTYKL